MYSRLSVWKESGVHRTGPPVLSKSNQCISIFFFILLFFFSFSFIRKDESFLKTYKSVAPESHSYYLVAYRHLIIIVRKTVANGIDHNNYLFFFFNYKKANLVAKLSNIKIYILPASGEEWEKQTKRNERNTTKKKNQFLKLKTTKKKKKQRWFWTRSMTLPRSVANKHCSICVYWMCGEYCCCCCLLLTLLTAAI